MKLTSNAFSSGEAIPARYTCDDQNVSPPLDWVGVPNEAQSLVLICDDPDARAGIWSHWVLYDIPADSNGLPEGVPADERPSAGGAHGRNDFGNLGYGGPCPPPGPAHTYYFRLYALDEQLNLPSGATRAQVLDRIQDHIVDRTELIGRYARSR